uniref:Uncharacterized protein n=1 Tax=Anopheles dirus TaxID=7168 RepID=A0A182N104_9DIPT
MLIRKPARASYAFWDNFQRRSQLLPSCAEKAPIRSIVPSARQVAYLQAQQYLAFSLQKYFRALGSYRKHTESA